MNRQVTLEVHLYSTGYSGGADPGYGFEGDGSVLFKTTSSDPDDIKWDELNILTHTILRGLINLNSTSPQDAKRFASHDLYAFQNVIDAWDFNVDKRRTEFKHFTERIESFTARTRLGEFRYKAHLEEINNTLRFSDTFEGFGLLASTAKKYTGLRHFIMTTIWYFWKCREEDDSYLLALMKICATTSSYFLQNQLSTATEHQASVNALVQALATPKQWLQVEEKLKEYYISMFVRSGQPLSEAQRRFTQLFHKIKQEAQKEGTIDLPLNWGDVLLQDEPTEPKVKAWLAPKRSDGVKDVDIRKWWNMHDLERRMMLKLDEDERVAMIISFIDKNRPAAGFDTPEEKNAILAKALEHSTKFFPVWTTTAGTKDDLSDDRPLPHELRSRVIDYMNRRQSDPKFTQDLEQSTSFNALVRREIRQGRL
jgi:hypothetical protein